MKNLLLCVSVASVVASCSDANITRETLTKAGYTNIRTTGWAPLVCGQDDTYSTGFTAVNQVGIEVSGVVCCGLIFKSCTVRF